MEELAGNKHAELDEQKEIFTASIVHDLKNPLNAQISALEQIYHEKFGAVPVLQKEILNDIINSSKFMREMLSSLLCSYKFENGAVILNKTMTDIDNLIKICLKEILPLADERCIFIKYVNTLPDSTILCDENYIRRVLYNMLNNVTAYSYKNTSPAVILEGDALSLSLKFKSTGFPIKEEFKPHIFDKYNSSLHKKSGTGLGLYFCRQAIEAHGGIITLKSKNSDIEFCIKLPRMNKDNNITRFE